MTAAGGDRYDAVWRDVYGDIQTVGPAHRHMRRLLRRRLADLDYESVIDVGCGAGHNLPLLCERRSLSRVTGLDVSAEALRRARERFDAELVQGSIEAGALDGRWDLVFSALVLEHLPDDEAALRNMREMTGRNLLVATMAGDFDRYRRWEEQVGHVRNYRPGELEAKLEAAGFSVREVTYWGFPFFSPIGRVLQSWARAAPRFGPLMRLAAELLYALYFLNSARRGDLVIVLAE